MSFEEVLEKQQERSRKEELRYAKKTARCRAAAREQQRARKYRRLYYASILLWVIVCVLFMTIRTGATEAEQVDMPDGTNTTATVIAKTTPEIAMTAAETPVEEEAEGPAYYGEFTVTYYCCEKYAHICGTGDGITASGAEVTAYRSCAVDPDVIPLGSEVRLHMEDGRILYYIAEDTGAAIKGNRIDLALPTHEEAERAGITTASVYVEVIG